MLVAAIDTGIGWADSKEPADNDTKTHSIFIEGLASEDDPKMPEPK